MAAEMRAIVQKIDCVKAARIPIGLRHAENTMSVLRVRLIDQPALCIRRATYPLMKLDASAKTKGIAPTKRIPCRSSPRSSLRKLGIQKMKRYHRGSARNLQKKTAHVCR